MNEYPENVSALQDLGIGRIDAVIVDSVVARYYISSENADYVILDESLSPETYAVGVKKGNTELQEKFRKPSTTWSLTVLPLKFPRNGSAKTFSIQEIK